MLTTWVLIVFLAYFAALIGIAVFRSRQMKEMSDYVLAGRRVGSLTSALSSGSSVTSGWTMLVFPALAFTNGAVELWTVLGIVLGIWLSWLIFAKRLRRYTIATENSLTFPEFFAKRFGDKWGVLRTLSAVLALFFIIFYISSGLIAGSKLLETVFGLDGIVGILVTLVAVASYTFIGGFLAVSRTDVFQALIMLAGFIILPVTLLFITAEPFQGFEDLAPGFWNPFTDINGDGVTVTFLLSAAGWGLGGFGSLRILQRFMAVASEEAIGPSRDISTLWTLLIFLFGLLLGLVALPALAEVGRMEEVTADAERLYLVAATVFFTPVIAGVLLSAVIAAVMSTADSQLLLASAMATDDLPLIRRYAYSKRYVFLLGAFARVWLGRFLLVVVGLIAALLSIFNPDSVYNLVSYAWGGMGSAFGPLILLALYWRRFNFWGALASMVAGTVIASIWGYFSGGPGGVMDIQPATPGFFLTIPIAVAVTLLTARPSEEITEVFDDVVTGWAGAKQV